MLFRSLLTMIGLLLVMAPGSAAAGGRERPKWGDGGAWGIYVDPNASNRCYAVCSLRGGITMLISVRPDGGLDLAIGSGSWHFAQPGKTYRLTFVFGNDATYEEALEGVDIGVAVVLSKGGMSAAFQSDFMAATSLLVYHQGSLIGMVSLPDSYDAVTQLRTCDASVAGTDYSDPSLR